MGAPLVMSGTGGSRVYRGKDEVAVFSEEVKAGGMVLAEITFTEV
jgi:hypothetical protein